MKRALIIVVAVILVLTASAVLFATRESAEPTPLDPPPVVTDEEPTDDPADTPDTTPPGNDTPDPLPSGSAAVVRTISTSDKVVALTFDAGSDAGFAADILDTLKTEGIKASFGMTGKWAQQNPVLVKRMADEGHDFINHTWTHRSFTGFSTDTAPLTQTGRWDELTRTEVLIQGLTGLSTRPFFRPPFGDYDASVNRDIYAQGYRYNVMWTVDSLGWKGLTKEQITRRVVDGTVPGAIHLFHVGSESQDAAALPAIIRELRAKGYTFVRISDLL